MNDLFPLALVQIAELDDRLVSIARTTFISAAVPHDGFEHVASTAVVKPFHTAATLGSQATSPQGSGATPACTDVVLHPKSVLHEVGIGPYLLMGIAGPIAV